MCNPPAVMLALTVASTALSMKAQEEQAASQRSMHRYQQKLEENKAIAARYEADAVRKQAEREAREKRRSLIRAQGNQRSLLANRGLDLSNGSALNVLMESSGQASLAEQQVLHAGEMQAWKIERSVDSLLGSAAASGMEAKAAGVSGTQRASTLVDGAKSITKAYEKLEK